MNFDRICELVEYEHESLFFSIVSQSSNAVVITDINKKIVYVNRIFEKLTGFTQEEVRGKKPCILRSNKTSRETYIDLHQKIYAGKRWEGEFVNLKRDGSEYIEETVISPIIGKNGNILCFYAEKKNVTVQRKVEKSIERLAHFDSLTGLCNRTYFINQTDTLTQLELMEANYFSVLFADLNRFKALNDTYGHMAGDQALKEVASRFSQAMSDSDLVARVGGDEFVIVHKNATEESTRLLAEKLSNCLTTPILIRGVKFILGVSVGSARWPFDGQTIEQILSKADLAMYKAKTQGDKYAVYKAELSNTQE